jgi:hypothetical protein
MEPGTTTGASLALRFWLAIKDAPLWMLTATTAVLVVFLLVPSFNAAVSPNVRTWVAVGATAFGIFALSRFGSLCLVAWKAYQLAQQANKRFHLTPVLQRCHWGTTRQQDQSVITQISAELTAKNLKPGPLHLLTAKLVKPRIRGEITNSMLLVHDPGRGGVFGSAQVSGTYIPGNTVRQGAITILIRGLPRQKPGKIRPLRAVLAVADAAGNQQRIKLELTPYVPNAEAIRS